MRTSRRFDLTAAGFLVAALPAFGMSDLPPSAVQPKVRLAAQPFDLAQVRLGPGPFREAMERDRAYLLRLEPDRLLHTFRLNVGLPSHAEPYGGWEAPTVELRGHSLGHYLSACALMYRSTGDEEFKRRVDYLVAELARCQAAAPAAGFNSGYLSAFPESFIDRVEARREVWAPWYTLHKVMAGLLDSYQLTGNLQARAVLAQMADWIKARVDRLTPEQMQASLQTEFGGMNEVLANLHAATGNPDHLRLAQAFDHAAVFDPLAEQRDALDGLHANTQIPKVIGAAREFELTGDARYERIARFFWERVAHHRSYAIGGHSDREHFFPPSEFAQHLSPETTETCNTYNMLKLTRQLFAQRPDAHAMDFYERGLFNHILGSQDPALGTFVYLMALESGHFKTYSTPEDSFWCCVGTGMENHAKYGDTIFAHDDRGLFVNLFIAAEVTWPERGIRLRQETEFPNEDATRLVWSCEAPVELTLRLRHPGWADGALTVAVNGVRQDVVSRPGSYLELRRTWQDGDRVEVRFPFALRMEMLPGTTDLAAVLYGPIVLAGKLGNEAMPPPYARDQLDLARFPHPAAPVFVAADSGWLSRVEMVSRHPLLFRTRGLGQPRDVLLAPFYSIHHERSAVYWRLMTPAAFAEHQQRAAAIAKQWETERAGAVDFVQPGDVASETSHHVQAQKSDTGTIAGRSWRQAKNGGEFSYVLRTQDAAGLSLVCAYGSRDLARNFEVLVDGQSIASPKPDTSTPGEIVLERYALPTALVAGKTAVTVSFRAAARWDAATASVFGCALVAAAESPAR